MFLRPAGRFRKLHLRAGGFFSMDFLHHPQVAPGYCWHHREGGRSGNHHSQLQYCAQCASRKYCSWLWWTIFWSTLSTLKSFTTLDQWRAVLAGHVERSQAGHQLIAENSPAFQPMCKHRGHGLFEGKAKLLSTISWAQKSWPLVQNLQIDHLQIHDTCTSRLTGKCWYHQTSPKGLEERLRSATLG